MECLLQYGLCSRQLSYYRRSGQRTTGLRHRNYSWHIVMPTQKKENPMQTADTTQSTTTPITPIAPVSPEGSQHLALIVPHEEGQRQAEAMETWFQACSTDSPFALELVGTSKEQCFVLRASSEDQLILLSKQFEAQYPQAEISRIATDPLVLR